MKKWLKRLKKDERGLTLVELLAVVVILAIVAAIAFVLIGNVVENSKKDAHIANAQQIISAAKLAEVSGEQEFSDTAVDVMELDTVGTPVDPWDKDAYASANVTKDEAGEYSITLTLEDTESDKCPISPKTESELLADRDTICGD